VEETIVNFKSLYTQMYKNKFISAMGCKQKNGLEKKKSLYFRKDVLEASKSAQARRVTV